MARGKKVKTGGKSRGLPRHGQSTNGRQQKSPRTHSSGDDRETSGFTLRDAARGGHRGAFSSPISNLRHRSIGFVRSVGIEPQDQLEAEHTDGEIAADVPQPPTPYQEVLSQTDDEANPDTITSSPSPAPQLTDSLDAYSGTAVLGERPCPTAPEAAVTPRLITAPRRSLSPALSNSSDEVVVFRGRVQGQQYPKGETVGSTLTTRPLHSPLAPLESCVRPNSVPESYNTSQPTDPDLSKLLLRDKDDSSYNRRTSGEILGLQDEIRFDRPRRSRHKGKKRYAASESDEDLDGILDDYVANMREHGDEELVQLSALANADVIPGNDWASSDIEDFDDMSTSDEVLEVVQQILSKRQRPSGPQYLVVWDGQTVDDARWIAKSSLTMNGVTAMIASFEDDEKRVPEYPQDDSDEEDTDTPDSDDEDDSEDDHSANDTDDFKNEEDLIERRAARLSDEKLARLLAKQEEYGFGSDELVLFDGMFADGDESNDGLEAPQSAKRSKRKQGFKKSKRQLEFFDGFNEVVMFGGDDYGDFDVMDRERPSLGASSKRTSDPLTWGLSDSDQAEELREVWAADRRTKKAKKQEREELRAQGLLGKKNKFKPDLKMKYNEGMDIAQLGQELETFLFSEYESRALPPMDKRDRKVVHEIASVFGLKSLSKGSGRSRFPVLQKTRKTIDFDDALFARLSGRLNRRFYPRMDRKSTTSAGPSRGRGGGSGVSRGDTGYREGEVVGATAPELGVGNRGHAMLEKMGWTSGNALGALNNKGILQPIAHVIRTSRAGLG